MHSILKSHFEECKMFEGLCDKGYKELEKQEIEFHYKLALKTLMRVFIYLFLFLIIPITIKFLKKTLKLREENKRKSSRRHTKNSPKRKSKRKSSKYKNKLEFHLVNPLYTYLICLMCLKSWRSFAEGNDKSIKIIKEKPNMHMLDKEKEEIPKPNSPKNDIMNASHTKYENDPMELYMKSYFIVPNYIVENE